MAKRKTNKKESEEETQALVDALFELSHLEGYLNIAVNGDCHVGLPLDAELCLFLAKAISEKLNYYQHKYGFEVSFSDTFYLENFSDFIRRKEGLPVKSPLENSEPETTA